MALAKDRNTPSRSGSRRTFNVGATAIIHAGALVALNATAFAVPGSVSTTLVAVGRAQDHVDNSAGADGAASIIVEDGIFRFNNSAAGDLIAVTDIGADCFIVDDETVAKTNGGATRSKAGTVYDVDAQGVWVKF